MIKNRKLDSLIKQALVQSVDKGKLMEPQIKAFTKSFSTLSRGQAIYCLSKYLKLLTKKMTSNVLEIETPVRLQSAEINEISESFSTDYPFQEVKVTINPAILGGLRIRIGDDIYEDSINSKVAQLKKTLVS